MSRAAIKLAAVLTAVSLVALVTTAAAVAAVSVSLGSPNGKHVKHGHIKVVVAVHGSSGGNLYVLIAGRKQVNAGHLNATCNVTAACDTLKLHPWRGHPGKWIYTGRWFTFPGYWASSKGKRFWQAEYFCPGTSCQSWSNIGSFTVT
jgi:hypothetical protein